MKRLSILSYSMGSGGAERVIYHLLPELMKEFRVYLFLIYNDVHYPIPEGVTVESLYPTPHNHHFRAVRSIPEGVRKYRRFLADHQIDISLSFTFRPNIINSIATKNRKGTRCILSERDYPGGLNGKSTISHFIHGLLRKKYYNWAELIISNSTHINVALKEKYGVNVPMTVIYNPVIIPENSAVVKEQGDLEVISVGQFNPLKNHMLLLRALKEQPQMKLTILGDGRMRTEYEEYLSQWGLKSRVSLPGKTKNVYESLLQSDVFVLSSNTEGFPNALLEAMSAGLPVIATNCMSGPLEMLNDNRDIRIDKENFAKAEYGLMINLNDHIGLIKALSFLEDKEKRAHYSSMSRRRSFDYNLERISAQYIRAISGQ